MNQNRESIFQLLNKLQKQNLLLKNLLVMRKQGNDKTTFENYPNLKKLLRG